MCSRSELLRADAVAVVVGIGCILICIHGICILRRVLLYIVYPLHRLCTCFCFIDTVLPICILQCQRTHGLVSHLGQVHELAPCSRMP
jgi:hypothetical protein